MNSTLLAFQRSQASKVNQVKSRHTKKNEENQKSEVEKSECTHKAWSHGYWYIRTFCRNAGYLTDYQVANRYLCLTGRRRSRTARRW